MSKHIIGIDLGTTNSCVAVVEGTAPHIIVNDEGERTTPSVVCFGDDGTTHVGATARRQAVIKPKETVYSVKRMIGSKYGEVKDIAENMPYDCVKAKSGEVQISVTGRKLSPPEISAKVLQKLKRQAEAYLGEEVTEAVVTVPAYFNDSQRQATKDAGKIAGLNVKRIINEPTAAALAYGLDKKSDEVLAVYDFGGGTFDISILEVGDGVVEVLSTNGDTHLGGDNVDEVLIDFLREQFKQDSGIDVGDDAMAMQRLKEVAEKTKKELSSKTQCDVNLPFFSANSSGPQHLNVKLTRSKFEQLIEDIVEKTFKSCAMALKDADKTPKDVDQVVMVGGSTRIPLVLKRVEEFFGKEPNRSVNPDEVVAAGAAVQGGILAGKVDSMLLLDVTPLSLGIETMGGVCTVLIPRNTTVPANKSEVFSTAADNQTSVDIHVLQGERKMAEGNRTIGNFKLDGLPPAPRGVPQVEVTFDLDADGLLNVTAVDKATGKEQKITITSSSGLSDTEIDRMVQDAKDNEARDEERRKQVEERNQLDTLTYQAEKLLDDQGDKMSSDQRGQLENALEGAKAALKSDDHGTFGVATEALNTALQEVAKAMYAEAQPEEGASGPVNGGPADDDVIDADFVEE